MSVRDVYAAAHLLQKISRSATSDILVDARGGGCLSIETGSSTPSQYLLLIKAKGGFPVTGRYSKTPGYGKKLFFLVQLALCSPTLYRRGRAPHLLKHTCV